MIRKPPFFFAKKEYCVRWKCLPCDGLFRARGARDLMAVARALLLSVASASSLAIRSRVPLSQPLRAASVRMMAGAADDPAAFVKSTVASDKVAPPPQPPSLAPPSPLPAPLPRRSRANRAQAVRRPHLAPSRLPPHLALRRWWSSRRRRARSAARPRTCSTASM